MKKKLVSVVFASFILVVSAVPVMAHGHRGGGGRSYYPRAVNYAVCGVADCTLAGLHSHSGKSYLSHYYGDGHDYHGYCDIVDCDVSGYHEHDGEYHFAHTARDGHSYHYSGIRHH